MFLIKHLLCAALLHQVSTQTSDETALFLTPTGLHAVQSDGERLRTLVPHARTTTPHPEAPTVSNMCVDEGRGYVFWAENTATNTIIYMAEFFHTAASVPAVLSLDGAVVLGCALDPAAEMLYLSVYTENNGFLFSVQSVSYADLTAMPPPEVVTEEVSRGERPDGGTVFLKKLGGELHLHYALSNVVYKAVLGAGVAVVEVFKDFHNVLSAASSISFIEVAGNDVRLMTRDVGATKNDNTLLQFEYPSPHLPPRVIWGSPSVLHATLQGGFALLRNTPDMMVYIGDINGAELSLFTAHLSDPTPATTLQTRVFDPAGLFDTPPSSIGPMILVHMEPIVTDAPSIADVCAEETTIGGCRERDVTMCAWNFHLGVCEGKVAGLCGAKLEEDCLGTKLCVWGAGCEDLIECQSYPSEATCSGKSNSHQLQCEWTPAASLCTVASTEAETSSGDTFIFIVIGICGALLICVLVVFCIVRGMKKTDENEKNEDLMELQIRPGEERNILSTEQTQSSNMTGWEAASARVKEFETNIRAFTIAAEQLSDTTTDEDDEDAIDALHAPNALEFDTPRAKTYAEGAQPDETGLSPPFAKTYTPNEQRLLEEIEQRREAIGRLRATSITQTPPTATMTPPPLPQGRVRSGSARHGSSPSPQVSRVGSSSSWVLPPKRKKGSGEVSPEEPYAGAGTPSGNGTPQKGSKNRRVSFTTANPTSCLKASTRGYQQGAAEIGNTTHASHGMVSEAEALSRMAF